MPLVMGYPLRFSGADVVDDAPPFEDEGVALPGRFTFEVTFRTVQERFLLRPGQKTDEIILGCLGRAAHRYPTLGLHYVVVLSNHGNLLVTPDCSATLSNFMRDFKSTVANRLNDQLDRSGPFWSRRYRAIPTTDEAALEERFRYLLTQGTKENLVESADQWPGVHAIHALRGGKPLIGRWRDGTAESALQQQRQRKIARASARGETLQLGPVPQVWREYPIKLEPLPHWQHEKPGTVRQRVAAIVRDDAAMTKRRHKQDGTRPLGRQGILTTHPFAQPTKSKKSPAPMCHASNAKQRRVYRRAYRAFAHCVQTTVDELAQHRDPCGVPPGHITRPLPSPGVVKNNADVEPTFVGGDPRLHYDPFDLAAAARASPSKPSTGPPARGASNDD
jgi:hypothetical protein